jgi:hypothetical protein
MSSFENNLIIYQIPLPISILDHIQNYVGPGRIKKDDERYEILLKIPFIQRVYDTIFHRTNVLPYRRDYNSLDPFYCVILKINNDKDYIIDYCQDRLRLSLHKYYIDYCEVWFRDYYFDGNNDNQENYDVLSY